MQETFSNAPPEHGLENTKILIVEDSIHVANAMKSLLAEFGMHPVGPAANVREAMALFEQHRPDVAIVDVNLEQELATDLIADLSGRGVRIVVATGYSFPPLQADTYKALLQKPFGADDLLNAIRLATGSAGT
jgi:DNA-binding NtrC family response regulator